MDQMELPGTGQGEAEDLPPLTGTRKCQRTLSARSWNHDGWQRQARTVAVWCLMRNPGCVPCRNMLNEQLRR